MKRCQQLDLTPKTWQTLALRMLLIPRIAKTTLMIQMDIEILKGETMASLKDTPYDGRGQ